MIFKIVDGRSCFYQWDIDRQISVSDPTITEVHFCNRTDSCSLVVEVKDGIANVPNKVLQSGYKVRVFGYDGKATLHEATFEVKARTKPIDYIYTETEIKHYADLERRLDEIEREGFDEEVVNTAVNNYLSENSISLNNYYNKEEIDSFVDTIPKQVSQLENDKEYISLNDRAANPRNAASLLFLSHFKNNPVSPVNKVDNFTKDLRTDGIVRWMGIDNTDYNPMRNNITGWFKCNSDGTFKDINYNSSEGWGSLKYGQYYLGYTAQIYEFESFDLIKKALSNSIAYDNATSGLEATTIVEAINELASRPSGDGGTVDLTGYATEEYVDNAISSIDIPDVDLTDYYTKTEVDNLLADMPSGGGGLTEEEVQELIDNTLAGLDGDEVIY